MNTALCLGILLGSVAMAGAADAASARRETFGRLPDGAQVEAVVLTGSNGVSARVITYGATLQSLNVPDRQGRVADVTLGYDDLDSYVRRPNFWGQTIGRYANRIAGGRFTLDGRAYQLTLNDKTNSLHGGTEGWDKRNWRITNVGSANGAASVTMELVSPSGDQGYPGRVTATATYALDDRGSLTIDYRASTDAPTIINMTNHALFDMAGEGSRTGILAQRLTIPAARYTPVNSALIPTGQLAAVAGTPFDFRQPRAIGDAVRNGRDPQIMIGQGIDHNYVIDAGKTAEPKLMARLEDPASGRTLEVLSDQPGVQVYTGNFLTGTLVGKGGHAYRMGDGLALEPQVFPDTPNQPSLGSARLDPGKPYHHRMIFRVFTAR
jgi:aldose 1-epimerase